jgi:hypothetical protein
MMLTRHWQWLVVALGALLSLHATAADWIKHENPAPVVGVDGKAHSATCSGFPGTDPTFSFWTRQGTSKNLVVYFDGGGACFDDISCSFPIAPGVPPELQFFLPAIPPGATPANFHGMFKFDQAANPVKDWSFVYVPYCTGDLHLGSATKLYSNMNPAIPLPAFPIQHRGFDNFMVVLDWIRNNVAGPKNILVAGSSAGGYGASASFPWVKESFPSAHMYVIADASQGVTTDTWDISTPGRNSWNPTLAPWVFGTDPNALVSQDLLRTSALAYPSAKVSQFTTNVDGTQIQFYAYIKTYYPSVELPGGLCPNVVPDWNAQMLDGLKSYSSDVNNYRSYLAGGTYHTILRTPNFYTESSPGITYSKWMTAMLQNRGGTDGTGGGDWKNVACPTCRVPLPCQ